MTLKLGQQGIIILFVLLFFELLFVWQYSSLLDQAEIESRNLEKTKEIITRGSKLLQQIYDAADAVGKYSMHHQSAQEQRYHEATAAIARTLNWLKVETEDNKGQTERLSRIEQNIDLGLSVLKDMKEKTDHDTGYVAAFREWSAVQPHVKALVTDLKEFLNTEREIESRSPEAKRQQREKTKQLLIAGGTVNAGLALALAFFFIGWLRSRLNVVIDNSDRFRGGEPLREPLKGHDEIAVLDGTFHNMVDTLRGQEEVLKSSEQQIRSMIEHMPVGLLILDGTGVVEFANPSIERCLRYGKGDLIGREIEGLFSCQAAADEEAALFDWLEHNSMMRVVELIGNRRASNPVQVEWSMTDVSFGDAKRRLAMIIDVSQRHAMQKLRQAFVAMVSHELRTPLTSVGGFLHLLETSSACGQKGADRQQQAEKRLEPGRQQADSGEAKSRSGKARSESGESNGASAESWSANINGEGDALSIEVKVAQSNVAQLILLITDLLDLEKTEADRMTLAPSNCCAEDLIDEAVDAIGKLLEEKKQLLDFEGSDLEVSVDKDKMHKALTSFLTGVSRVTPVGRSIEIKTEEGGKDSVAIIVTSAHVDVSAAQREAMFERFQHVEVEGVRQSLGLCFALSQAIVRRHGGSVGVDECEGGGTTFWLRVPAAD